MEDNKAPYFEMPDEAAKMAHSKPFHTSMRVPHPTNERAKECNAEAIMRAVNQSE